MAGANISIPMTATDLSKLTCDTPGCNHKQHGGEGLFLHGRCHPRAGAEVEYVQGILYVRCNLCKRRVVDIKVAEMT